MEKDRIKLIRKIYLYIFSTVGLVLLIIGSIQIIDLGLKYFVFTKADYITVYPIASDAHRSEDVKKDNFNEEHNKKLEEYNKEELIRRRQREASNAIAMIIVGLPLFLYHWRLTRED